MNIYARRFLWPVLLVLLAVTARAEEPSSVPQLSVSGQAELQVPADRLRLSIGVVTQAPSAEKALEENNSRMRAVAEALRRAGLSEKEMETGQFRIEPQRSSPPPRPEAGWRPQIIGYTVTNSLNLRTTRLDLAGHLIAAAGKAGANDIGSLYFDLADPRRYRAEAIRTATANARADAHALAEAASVRLVRVLSLRLDETAAVPLPMAAERFAMKAAAEPVIAPGEVTVRAAVSMLYEVAPLAEEPKDQGGGK